MRVIAVDYGSKRCGIAVSDPLKIIATPLDIVPQNELKSFLITYCKNNEVEGLVFGMPKRLNNQPNPICKDIESFISKIKEELKPRYIDTYDERFTSKIAQASILASGVNKKTRSDKSLIDKVSASILLQDYLSYKQNIK